MFFANPEEVLNPEEVSNSEEVSNPEEATIHDFCVHVHTWHMAHKCVVINNTHVDFSITNSVVLTNNAANYTYITSH